MKALLTIALLTVGMSVCAAQTNTAPRRTTKPAPTAGRQECALGSGLCVTVPATWQRLGDVFGDLGFVVAEPHAGEDNAKWPQLTVAAIDVPQKDTNGAAPSLDTLVELVLAPDRNGLSSQTLERSRLVLNGHEAEVIRVQLHDAQTGSDKIEQVALIAGDEDMVYSIALRCAPEEFARLESVFQRAIHSWQLRLTIAKPRPNENDEKK